MNTKKTEGAARELPKDGKHTVNEGPKTGDEPAAGVDARAVASAKMEADMEKLGAADNQAEAIISAAETNAATTEKEAEDYAAELIKTSEAAADKVMNEAEEKAAEIIKEADKKADDIVSEADMRGETADEVVEDAESDAKSIIEIAEEKATEIIKAAEDKTSGVTDAREALLKEEAARQAETDEAKAAEAAREKEKKKAFKAKQAAIKKPQAIAKGKLNDAILLAGELGNMPTDITNLMMHLRKSHGFVLDGNPPVHTVTGYGLTAQGPGGFKSALTNWAAAVRRIAAAGK